MKKNQENILIWQRKDMLYKGGHTKNYGWPLLKYNASQKRMKHLESIERKKTPT
jgi:hypothetical protein